MPTPTFLLDHLSAVANQAWPIAVAWHVVAFAFLCVVLLGWRPPRRVLGALLALPVLSVAGVAWYFDNPFNGAVFVVLAIALLGLSVRLGAEPVGRPPAWVVFVGAAMVGFGLLYPHFLDVETRWAFLLAAPTGLIPCPTLILVTGGALLADGLGSRAWSAALAVAGLFYGAVGVFLLGVTLDVVLLVGAVALLAHTLLHVREQPAPVTNPA